MQTEWIDEKDWAREYRVEKGDEDEKEVPFFTMKTCSCLNPFIAVWIGMSFECD